MLLCCLLLSVRFNLQLHDCFSTPIQLTVYRDILNRRHNICMFPQDAAPRVRSDRQTGSVCRYMCVWNYVCVLGEGWLLLKCGAPVWTFPLVKSRRQPRAPALGYLAAPRCFQALYQHHTLIQEQQQQLLSHCSAPLQRGAPLTRSLHFRMHSSPSLHLYH